MTEQNPWQSNPPPVPPPIPAPVIGYASPMAPGPRAKTKANPAQQAAKFSWAAPLVALALGTCLNGANAKDRDPITGAVMAGFNVLIILAGLVAGIIALLRMRRHGREGVLVPAIIGVSINSFLVLSIVVLVIVLLGMRKKVAAPSAPPPMSPAAQAQYQAQAVTQSRGWVGAGTYHGATVAIAAIAGGSDMDKDVQQKLQNHAQFLILTIDNSNNGEAIQVDPTRVVATGVDGRILQTLTIDQLRADVHDARQLLGKWGQPASIAANLQEQVVLGIFLPLDLDMSAVTGIEVEFDNKPFIIHGRVMSGEEKTENYRRSQARKAASGK